MATQARKDLEIASGFGKDILHVGISDNPAPKKAVINGVYYKGHNPPNQKQGNISSRRGKAKNCINSFEIKQYLC